jgi:hypothetical protein
MVAVADVMVAGVAVMEAVVVGAAVSATHSRRVHATEAASAGSATTKLTSSACTFSLNLYLFCDVPNVRIEPRFRLWLRVYLTVKREMNVDGFRSIVPPMHITSLCFSHDAHNTITRLYIVN